ncbi:MAG TPA: serine hydrolase domain-containing protein [Burkholderiaceae bacterium]
MRTPKIPTALLLSLLIAATQAGTPATPATLAAYAEKLLDEQRLGRDGPGVALLVARGDELLYQGARGMASIELGVPLQPQQLFRIGSVTKQFAAATLLRLIDEGKAKLDDPLSKFLPDYPNGAQITLIQLLNHTSGVKSYTGIPDYMLNQIRRDLTTAELIKEFKDQPVDFAPGQSWAYNNSGYVLVGAVIEAISGKAWHQQLSEALLQPAKLDVHYEAGDQLFKNMVRGYTRNDRGEVAPAGLLSMTQPHAAGALIANVESLWRWNRLLHGGKLLSAASYQRMITPEGAAKPRGYGYGITVGQMRGQVLLQHGGGIHGFVSALNYLPQSQTTVVILRNSDGPGFSTDTVARKLAAFAIGEPYPELKSLAVPPEALRAVEGIYALDEKRTRIFRISGGQLQTAPTGGRVMPLLAFGEDRFGPADSLTWMQLVRGADGKVEAMRIYPNGEGEGELWQRRGDAPARPTVTLNAAQVQALLGEYSAPEFSMKVFVDDKGVLRTQAKGQGAMEVKASGPRQLWLTAVDAVLEFSAEEGQAASATLIQGATRLETKRK